MRPDHAPINNAACAGLVSVGRSVWLRVNNTTPFRVLLTLVHTRHVVFGRRGVSGLQFLPASQRLLVVQWPPWQPLFA